MQSVCDVLEELLACGVIQKYAIGGATAAGFPGVPIVRALSNADVENVIAAIAGLKKSLTIDSIDIILLRL